MTVTDSPAEGPELRRTYGSHVSRVLASAGFARAETEPTSIRGHYRYSPGFEVRGSNQSWELGLLRDEGRAAGHVTVSCQTMDRLASDKPTDPRPHAEIVAEQVAAYAGALEAVGFDIETRCRSHEAYLVVLGRH